MHPGTPAAAPGSITIAPTRAGHASGRAPGANATSAAPTAIGLCEINRAYTPTTISRPPRQLAMPPDPSQEMLVLTMPLDTFVVQRNRWVLEDEDVPGTLEVLVKGSS